MCPAMLLSAGEDDKNWAFKATVTSTRAPLTSSEQPVSSYFRNIRALTLEKLTSSPNEGLPSTNRIGEEHSRRHTRGQSTRRMGLSTSPVSSLG